MTLRPTFWVTDMTHFLDEEGRLADMLAAARNVARHLGAIVAAVTSRRPAVLGVTAVRCRRRPGRRPCPGRISAVVEFGSGEVSWRCSVCGDSGLIHRWAGTPWDRRATVGK